MSFLILHHAQNADFTLISKFELHFEGGERGNRNLEKPPGAASILAQSYFVAVEEKLGDDVVRG
jgi:hypothetical protein